MTIESDDLPEQDMVVGPTGQLIFGAILGGVAGSFLATLVVRWPAGRSVAAGRSACDGCGRRLSPVELVPVLSFLIRRGRCTTCRAAIDWRHPALEIGAGLIGSLALGACPLAEGLAGASFGWLLLTLAMLDLEYLWLPDRITLPMLAIGLAVGAFGMAPPLVDRAIGATVGFVALTAIAEGYRLARGRVGMGAGDPKLFAAIGAWLGWRALPTVLLAAALLGLAAALALHLSGRPVGRAKALPFGAFLATAAWPIWLLSAGSW